jgi:hypothetical protein
MERSDRDLSVVEGLRREPHPRELAREAETVAAMAAVVRSCVPAHDSFERRRGLMLIQPLRVRTLAFLAAATLAATSALATAGALPAPAQDVVSGVLNELGLTLPDRAGGVDPSQTPADLPPAAETGVAVSELATGSDAKGVEKGAAISAFASDGKSRAGTRGAPSGAGEAPVETPNEGGTPTANTASGGASLDGSAGGTDTADTASDGRSAAGSGNADVAAGGLPPNP